MNPDQLRELCLSLPGSVETFPFGPETSVFKTEANNKIFALSSLEAGRLTVSVKCDPEDSLALQAEYPGITPGYHLNKRHWITVAIADSIPDDLVEQVVRDSHELIRPRTPRRG